MISAIEITYPPMPAVAGISPHGILTMVGVLVGAYLLRRETTRRGLPTKVLDDAVVWGVLAGIVGARADYVLFHLGQFDSIVDMLKIWEGGLALFGGLIGGLLAGVVVVRRAGAHVPRVLDATAPNVALAIGIGRIGDLLLTDHLGTPTDSPFALAYVVQRGCDLAPGFGTDSAVPPGPGQSCADVGQHFAGCGYHLTPAYDMLGALALALLLVVLRRRVPLPAGVAMAVFGLWYGTQRLLLDFTRGVDERLVLGLSSTQLISIVAIVASAALIVVIRVRGRGLGEEPDAPPSVRGALLTAEMRGDDRVRHRSS